jgi:hypothetical protein
MNQDPQDTESTDPTPDSSQPTTPSPPPSPAHTYQAVGQPYAAPPRRPAWPTVFGVLGIIFGSFGILSSCCGVLWIWIMPAYIDLLKKSGLPQDQIDMMQAGMPPAAWTMFSGVIGLALAILLLVGSIGLVRRKRSGVQMCAIWAVVQIIWVVLAIGLNYWFIAHATSGQQAPGQMFGTGIGLCCSAIFGLILPILMLIWFNLGGSKAEIATWESQPQPPVSVAG